MRGALLLYDKRTDRLQALGDLLAARGHNVDLASGMSTFHTFLDTQNYDLVHVSAGAGEIMDLLADVQTRNPQAEVILSSDSPTVEEAVEAIQAGAFHYHAWPGALDKIMLLVQRGLEKRMLSLELAELRSLLLSGSGPKIIGESPPMQELKKILKRIARLDCTVLISGETGTGKELVCRTIHEQSPRAEDTFLAVNCGALSEELLTNELFGHEKGAFTGAVAAKTGLFEAADHGTILLDEIGDTSPSLQVQLLRVLQEKTIMRVGGTSEIPVNVRVLAATNRSLCEEVAKGRFRKDLYYRLNVFQLRLPPLRERRDDIPLFCRYFLDKYSRQFGMNVERVSDDVMRLFMTYEFPGNVRELENILERAVALCDGTIVRSRHMPQRLVDAPVYAPVEGEPLGTLVDMERRHIQRVLQATSGNKTQAARILGIDRSSLWRKMKSFCQ